MGVLLSAAMLAIESADAPQWLAVHGQATFVVQANPPFPARFEGPNSLRSRGETRETADATLYVGVSPWQGGELWADPEIDQGFGLSNTTGAAGFPSGEAYKVGKASPYFRLQRLFFRQTIGLGGEREKIAPDLNQLGGTRDADRLVITLGKYSVADIFDTNRYAHDPRADFLNWTLIEAGAFDYAADAWGYSYGVSTELYRGRWAMRAGLFDLSKVPNNETLETGFRQYEAVSELEERHRLAGRPGTLKVTIWFNHGRMARLEDAIREGVAMGSAPDPESVRHVATRAGASFNLEQEATDDLGLFARASVADGRYEAFEFTDIDWNFSGGASLKGGRWGRPDDRIGVGLAINGISNARKRYLAAGGLGILVGDGALPRPGDEHIVEGWYDLAVIKGVDLTADTQLIDHPAYNRDRGPVAVFAGRLHAQF